MGTSYRGVGAVGPKAQEDNPMWQANEGNGNGKGNYETTVGGLPGISMGVVTIVSERGN